MYRRAYVLLVGVAALMGGLALIAGISLGHGLVDPEGFLGPSWARLPLLVGGALLLDMLPRTLFLSRLKPKEMWPIAKERWDTHWNRERIILVVMGIVCFYVTYVSYRNLKSFLPELHPVKFDRELYLLDQAIFFGHKPAVVLHDLLGTTISAHFLSTIYLWFLPMVPLVLTGWLIWTRNISYGYWFVTSQCLAWSLGTASYYALPTLGPGFEYPWLYRDLADTGASSLMEALSHGREKVLWWDGIQGDVQSVAGFASLHCAITLLVALMAQYTIKIRWLHWVLWVNFGLTIIATVYFGWHYLADDVAGIAIAIISFYLGGLASGQRFDRHGLASHPTTTTSKVPVDDDA